MSKSLEALERLKDTLLAEGYWQDILQDVYIIEKELKLYYSLKEDIKKCSCWKEHKALEIIRKCFYVAKSSGAILLTDYGFEHEEELKEVLNYGE